MRVGALPAAAQFQNCMPAAAGAARVRRREIPSVCNYACAVRLPYGLHCFGYSLL